ncbi:MAG TPA: N-acyl homoserine lactonase family protein [Candidatus Dormibacteraeota bacterium]|nr:N-acyl homoserine lactonase family protein [Candidatus Dormibacteraeota bacterium]
MNQIRPCKAGIGCRRSAAFAALLPLVFLSVAGAQSIPESASISAETTEYPSAPTSVQGLYVLDCGTGHFQNTERWTPGVNVGKPMTWPDYCFLIQDEHGYFLWDTGLPDYVASMPNGWQARNLSAGIHWTRQRTLLSELDQIGVKPADIKYIGISHTHPDHLGNVEEFPDTTVIISRDEYHYYFDEGRPPVNQPAADPVPGFRSTHPVILINEDWDVFHDGSVMMFATPGHPPGHESLLVHLKDTGWVILAGDSIHLITNFYNDQIPYYRNMPQAQRWETLLSTMRIRDLMNYYHAQLWLNHDPTQKFKMSPGYYQ